MRIISFIDEASVIRKIVTPVLKGMEYKPFGFNLMCLLPFLKHCGLWKELVPRPPPQVEEPKLDYALLSLRSPMQGSSASRFLLCRLHCHYVLKRKEVGPGGP
jgi:hypothetical protein